MIRFLLAATSAWGAYLLWTGLHHGWTGLRLGPAPVTALRLTPGRTTWDRAAIQRLAAVAASGLGGLAVGGALFGGIAPTIATALLGASLPATMAARRAHTRADMVREAWPRLIDEVRILTTAAGRSIPQALFDAAARAPRPLAAAFEPVRQQWHLSADFAEVVRDLKATLRDHTADLTLETLLVAHEVGGADVERRLAALAEDRRRDLAVRRSAAAEQAGVQFARRFVLVVPFGMAVAGASIGPGRASYHEASSQFAAVVALGIVAACWVWSGRIMHVPPPRRVLAR